MTHRFFCEECNVILSTRKKYDTHCETYKHRKRKKVSGSVVSCGFFCEECNVISPTRKKYDTHCETYKHRKRNAKLDIDNIFKERENAITEMRNENSLLKFELSVRNRRKISTTTAVCVLSIGFENCSYISKNQVLEFMKYPKSFLRNIMQIIHFNDNHPENQNIMLPNIKNKFYKIYNGNAFASVPIYTFLEYYVLTAIEAFDEIYRTEFLKRALPSRRGHWILKVEQLNNTEHENFRTRMNYEISELESLILDETDRIKLKKKKDFIVDTENHIDREKANYAIAHAQKSLKIDAVYIPELLDTSKLSKTITTHEYASPLRDISVKLFGLQKVNNLRIN